MPKCKYAKQVKSREGYTYCACKSAGAEWRSKYRGISDLHDLPVMGCSKGPKEPGNWWTMCIGGKAFDTGRTPSQCDYY